MPILGFTTCKGDENYSNQLRLFLIHLLGQFSFFLKQNQCSISNKKNQKQNKDGLRWVSSDVILHSHITWALWLIYIVGGQLHPTRRKSTEMLFKGVSEMHCS